MINTLKVAFQCKFDVLEFAVEILQTAERHKHWH
jgi:hypothetical protein